MTVVTVVAGLLSGSWITRWLDPPHGAFQITIPSHRRSVNVVLDLEIIAPSGTVWSPRLRAPLGATTLGTLAVFQRSLTLDLPAIVRQGPLKVQACAPRWQDLPPFSGEIIENMPAVLRLPLHDGAVTIRGHLYSDTLGI